MAVNRHEGYGEHDGPTLIFTVSDCILLLLGRICWKGCHEFGIPLIR